MGYGDYTAEREVLFADLTLHDEILAAIKQRPSTIKLIPTQSGGPARRSGHVKPRRVRAMAWDNGIRENPPICHEKVCIRRTRSMISVLHIAGLTYVWEQA
jgi:hypothetical protein